MIALIAIVGSLLIIAGYFLIGTVVMRVVSRIDPGWKDYDDSDMALLVSVWPVVLSITFLEIVGGLLNHGIGDAWRWLGRQAKK